MAPDKSLAKKIGRDITVSLFIYALPVISVYLYFASKGQAPWAANINAPGRFDAPAIFNFIKPVFQNLQSWGFIVIAFVLGIVEFSLGLYDNKWTKTERAIDIVCFVAPKVLLVPVTAFFGLKLLPYVIPHLANQFSWVPFWGGVFIIAVADDLTQYWYHRLHHQLPFLWRFHRTHHSAPYMGMAMASRQNFIYTVFFSQIYLTATLVYLGLGLPALFVTVLKSFITLAAHSSIAWDKPFYKYKILHPFAWVLERLISTPATHHAHHADTHDDGIGYYKGNFGNMFFLWDIIFGTGIITRKYPASYGIKFYKAEEWQAQFLWPIFKSKIEGSELSKNGPEVGDAVILARQNTSNKKAIGAFGITILSFISFASAFAQVDKKDYHSDLITADSFAAKINRQSAPQIIDVRTPEEFTLNHITGAISINLKEKNYLDYLQKFDKTKPVFIYAIQNNRPDILAKELRAIGYTEVYELRGGIAGWIGAGNPYFTSAKNSVSLNEYKKIISGNKLVLVDIGTKYCGLCAKAKLIVDSLQYEGKDSYKIVELELYNNLQLAAELKEISAVPTILLYKDGKIIWKRTGLTFNKNDINSEIANANGIPLKGNSN